MYSMNDHPMYSEPEANKEDTMDYLTTEQVHEWARHQPVGGYYCEHCLTRLAPTDEGNWYCPNEMCLYDKQGKIVEPNLN